MLVEAFFGRAGRCKEQGDKLGGCRGWIPMYKALAWRVTSGKDPNAQAALVRVKRRLCSIYQRVKGKTQPLCCPLRLVPPKVTRVTLDLPQKPHSRTEVPMEGSALLSYGRRLSARVPHEVERAGEEALHQPCPAVGSASPCFVLSSPASHGPCHSRIHAGLRAALMRREPGPPSSLRGSMAGTGFLTGTAGPWGGLERPAGSLLLGGVGKGEL